MKFFRQVLSVLAVFGLLLIPSSLARAAGVPSWTPSGNMATGRYYHTATLLPNGKVLVTGGWSSNLVAASAELYDPIAGTWTATGSLATARHSHTATLLPNGKVLVCGGQISTGSYLKSAELYDPATGAWVPAGSLATVRSRHTATLLPNGKVLVCGGSNEDEGQSTASAELYDPVTGTWTNTGGLVTARTSQTATLLPDGRVLVAGGWGQGSPLSSAELYDSATGVWTATGSLLVASYAHTATLLPGGKVLVAGGYGGGPHAELYNPVTGTWANTGSPAASRYEHTATLLPNGQVLLAGGSNGDYVVGAELYNPTTSLWAAAGSLATGRYSHTVTLLTNGKVLLTGGYNFRDATGYLSSTELFDSATDTWAATGSMARKRMSHMTTLLPNGQVLAAGGDEGGLKLASAELYDPGTGVWSATGSMAIKRYRAEATLLPTGRVLASGGNSSIDFTISEQTAELYDPATGTWSPTGNMAMARCLHTATLLHNGKVLVCGGYGGNGDHASAELYDTVTGTWTVTGSLSTARYNHTATLLPSGKVLVTGGLHLVGNAAEWQSAAELYDPQTGLWTVTGSMISGRYNHTATLLTNGKVLVAGGEASSLLASAEIYDPSSETWTETGSMAHTPRNHRAILLPDGRVLVSGAWNVNGGPYTSSAEVYDPATCEWAETRSPATPHREHTTTLLPNGKVLVSGGGYSSSEELYDLGVGYSATSRPQISSASFNGNGQLVLSGSGFNGISGGSHGDTQDSPTNYPLVQLRWLDNGQSSFLVRDSAIGASATSFTSTPMLTPANALRRGHALVTVYASGIPSASFLVNGNRPPVAPNGTVAATSGDPKTVALNSLVTTADPDGDMLRLTEVTASNGLAVTFAGGDLTITPNANFAGGGNLTYTVSDGFGGSATGTISVAVADNDAPAINGIPSDIHVTLSDLSGEVVTYSAPTATDAVDGELPVTCEPASGSKFPEGSHVVTCKARDVAGNVATATFRVIVESEAVGTKLLYGKGTAVVGAGEPDTGIPAGATWWTFGVPSINDEGRVAFIGTVKLPRGASLQGIFSGDSEAPALVVQKGGAAPGEPGAVFNAFRDPLLAPDGSVGFQATLSNSRSALYWDTDGAGPNPPALIARINTEAPGVPGSRWKAFTSLALSDEALAFTATMHSGPGMVTNSKDFGLWVYNKASETLKLVLREGDPLLSSKIKTIAALSLHPGTPGHGRGVEGDTCIAIRVTLVDGRQAVGQVIQDQAVRFPYVAGSNADVDDSNVLLWKSFGQPTQNTGGALSFLGTVQDSADGSSYLGDTSIFSEEEETFQLGRLVSLGDFAPGVPSGKFRQFQDPVSGLDRSVAFLGTVASSVFDGIDSRNDQGIWWRTNAGEMRLVAREGAVAAEVVPSVVNRRGVISQPRWQSFASLALPEGSGGPVFVGNLMVGSGGVTSANNSGLWGVDGIGMLRLLLRKGDPVGTSTVKSFTVLTAVPGSPCQTRSYNNSGQLVVRVTDAKGAQHLVVVRVP